LQKKDTVAIILSDFVAKYSIAFRSSFMENEGGAGGAATCRRSDQPGDSAFMRAVRSPLAIAASTFFTKVRIRDLRARLRSVRRSV
jgi:hypothetical protein